MNRNATNEAPNSLIPGSCPCKLRRVVIINLVRQNQREPARRPGENSPGGRVNPRESYTGCPDPSRELRLQASRRVVLTTPPHWPTLSIVDRLPSMAA